MAPFPTRAAGLLLALGLMTGAPASALAQAQVQIPPIPPRAVGPGGIDSLPVAPQPRTPYQDAVRLQRKGELDAALGAIRKHLHANPRDVAGRFMLGVILSGQKQSKEATDIFIELTREHPELPEPFNNLAVLYAAEGRYEDARNALEQSLVANPTNIVAQENLGDVHAQLARTHYERALANSPRNRTLRDKLAKIAELTKIPTGAPATDTNPGERE